MPQTNDIKISFQPESLRAIEKFTQAVGELNSRAQVDKLAAFILDYIPGEPSKNEGAVDTAIRLLRDYDNDRC